MASFSNVSLEFGHTYLVGATRESISSTVKRDLPWVRRILELFGPANVTTSVMIDDYSGSYRLDDPDDRRHDAERWLLEALQGTGVELDYLAFESECAESAKLFYDSYLIGQPGDNTEFIDPALAVFGGPRRRLDEKGPPGVAVENPLLRGAGGMTRGARRPEPPDLLMEQDAPPPRTGPEEALPLGDLGYEADVHVMVRDPRGDERWSCPMLAAWWQLLRLGAVRSPGTDPRAVGRPARPQPNPFFARYTVSILPASYVTIEAAVRILLGKVSIPPEDARHFWSDGGPTGPHAHLSRIQYVFV